MPTINQLVRRPRAKSKGRKRVSDISGSPQKRGVCLIVRTQTPKKPNSALRKIARILGTVTIKYLTTLLSG